MNCVTWYRKLTIPEDVRIGKLHHNYGVIVIDI